jgi:hypothetical protein
MHEDETQIVNTDEWLQTTDEKKTGVQMLTRVPNNINGMAAAYFKYPPPGQDGPVSANEFVACRIGRSLHLPTAKVQFKEFDGKHGVLSYLVAVEPTPWNQVPMKIKTALPLYLHDFKLLPNVLVFDTFINNIDRHGDNFMISRLTPLEEKYHFHLIDHGHSLLGPTLNQPPASFNFPQHIMLSELQDLRKNGIEYFHDALKLVTDLSEDSLRTIIFMVPDTYITKEQRDQMLQLLLQRQQTIYNEFKSYVAT